MRLQKTTLNPSMPERVHTLKEAIRGKCNHLPQHRLDSILKAVDPSRKYFIHATRDPQKFLNLISSESIVTKDIRFLSESSPIYGVFTAGTFSNLHGEKEIIPGRICEKTPAAAIKISFGNRFFPKAAVSYSLVIFEP